MFKMSFRWSQKWSLVHIDVDDAYCIFGSREVARPRVDIGVACGRSLATRIICGRISEDYLN
jgi:hypothetical protein